MNAKHILAFLLFGIATGSAVAQLATGQAAVAVVTAAQATHAKDDAHVVLQGTVVSQIKSDKYEFRDASGTITVEIDDDSWPNRQPILGSRVRLHGEVERKLIRRTVEVEVDLIEPLN